MLTNWFLKQQNQISSARRKQRKERYTADSTTRAKLMCAPLSKELRRKYGGVRSMPIRKDDRVRVVRGSKGNSEKLEGKVTAVYRKKYVIYIDRLTKEKRNGQTVQLPIDPSNVEITTLKMDKNRKAKLEQKLASRNAELKKKGMEPTSAAITEE